MATITLEGPRDVWYGLGFHALAMGDAPWTIIVEGNGSVMERKLASHEPGTWLKPSVTVQESQALSVRASESGQVVGAQRRVVLTRPLKGAKASMQHE